MSSTLSLTHHVTSYETNVQDLLQTHSQNPPIVQTSQPTATKTSLKYFNIRVAQRLRRYRSMRRHWHAVATSMQNTAPNTQDSTKNVPVSDLKPVVESKACAVHDGPNTITTERDTRERQPNESDVLHTRIQQDLIKLRRLINHRRREFDDNMSFVSAISIRPIADATSILTTADDQQISNGKTNKKPSSGSPKKLKPLDLVKVAGSQMRSSTLPKSDSTDSGIGTTSNSSSTCSQYPKPSQQKSKPQTNNKTFSICQSRVSLPPSHPSPPPPLPPSDSSPPQASPPSKKKANTSSKSSQNTRSRQKLPSRLALLVPQIPTIAKEKQPSFTKQEVRAAHPRRLSVCGDVTTRLYTYAAPSSSIAPRSMSLKRNTSLLPVLLKSSSCVGLSAREVGSINFEDGSKDEQEEGDTNGEDDDYNHLLSYKHLINALPKSVVSIRPRYGQDDYGILFDQLARIRERMPDSNIYDEYARTA